MAGNASDSPNPLVFTVSIQGVLNATQGLQSQGKNVLNTDSTVTTAMKNYIDNAIATAITGAINASY